MSRLLKNNDNWAYFNGVNASSTIGTTSTFGWMNSGNFRVEFDFVGDYAGKNVGLQRSYTLGTTTPSVTARGFTFYSVTNGTASYPCTLYYMNGSGAYAATITQPFTTYVGQKIHHTLVADAALSTLTCTIENRTIGTSGVTVATGITFIPCATTSNNLIVGLNATTNNHKKCISNIEIFQSTDRSVPFFKMLSDLRPEALYIDEVSRIAATNYYVYPLDLTGDKCLANKGISYVYFNSTTGNTYLSSVGSTSTFNWIHQTGIFEISFDCIILDNTTSDYTFYNSYNTGNGIFIGKNGSQIRCWMNKGGGLGTMVSSTPSPTLIIGTLYRIRVVGDGVKLTVYANDNPGSPQNFLGYGTGNAAAAGILGGGGATQNCKSYIRNMKFYDEGGKLKYWYPLDDLPSINMEVFGGLGASTVNGIITTVQVT